MKVISLPANKYHKPGQVINTDESTAKHLIEKGYAKAEGDDAGTDEATAKQTGSDENNQKSKPNNKKQK